MIDLERSIQEQRTRQGVWGPYKTPTDLARYCEILGRVKPLTLMEAGSGNGQSARWLAQLVPHVVSLDIRNVGAHFEGEVGEEGAGLALVHADSVVWALTVGPHFDEEDAPVMVSLDSDHSADHVAQELEAFAPLVSFGSYLVVEDTIIRWLPEYRDRFGDGPLAAVEKFLAAHPEFEQDLDIEDRWPTTQNPGGWLRRVR
jgi:cephalosporin hydroxylase